MTKHPALGSPIRDLSSILRDNRAMRGQLAPRLYSASPSQGHLCERLPDCRTRPGSADMGCSLIMTWPSLSCLLHMKDPHVCATTGIFANERRNRKMTMPMKMIWEMKLEGDAVPGPRMRIYRKMWCDRGICGPVYSFREQIPLASAQGLKVGSPASFQA